MMYCPKSVRYKGPSLKVSLGKNKSGAKVKTICTNAKITVPLLHRFKIRNNPIPTSQIARSIIETLSGINPKVSS